MHEIGTILYIIDKVESVCKENDLHTVGSVTLELGEVSGIIPAFLQDYWSWAAKESEYTKDAVLKIETLPAVTHCAACGRDYPTLQYAKICPHCHSENTYLLRGREYNIKEIEAC